MKPVIIFRSEKLSSIIPSSLSPSKTHFKQKSCLVEKQDAGWCLIKTANEVKKSRKHQLPIVPAMAKCPHRSVEFVSECLQKLKKTGKWYWLVPADKVSIIKNSSSVTSTWFYLQTLFHYNQFIDEVLIRFKEFFCIVRLTLSVLFATFERLLVFFLNYQLRAFHFLWITPVRFTILKPLVFCKLILKLFSHLHPFILSNQEFFP